MCAIASDTRTAVNSGSPAHFLFDDEHQAFRKTIRQFLEREINPHADAWEEAGRMPKEMFLRGGALGFFGHCVPEEFGGHGGDCRWAVVLAEELAHARTSGVGMGFGAHSEIAMPHIVKFGTPAQKQKYLSDLVAGRKVAALGITEPGAGSNVAGIQTRAVRDGSGWRLTGSKIFITNSLNADVFCVLTKTNPDAGHRGMTMFLVDRNLPGFTIEEMKGKLGRRGSDTGLLTFDSVPLASDALLGEEGRGFHQVMKGFENERLTIAAGAVGAADYALAATKEYIQARPFVFGTLSDMQVTKQRMCKNYMEIEAARSLVHTTAWRIVRGMPSLTEVAMAKAFASEAAARVIDDCLQLHGGYGYFAEYQIERAWRDIRLDRIGGGATEVMYDIIAKQLGI